MSEFQIRVTEELKIKNNRNHIQEKTIRYDKMEGSHHEYNSWGILRKKNLNLSKLEHGICTP